MIFVDDWVDNLCVCMCVCMSVCVFMFLSLKADVNNLCHHPHLCSRSYV